MKENLWRAGAPIATDLADCLEPGDKPLPVARFTRRWGSDGPIPAMIKAAGQVHDEYSSKWGAEEVLSVQRYCQLLGVRLLGSPPQSRPLSFYSGGMAEIRGRSSQHSGRILLGNRPQITIPESVDRNESRLSIAHELGHLLIHKVEGGLDETTIRLDSSPQEEAIAEFAARLLLLPGPGKQSSGSIAKQCLREASRRRVPLRAAAARAADSDRPVSAIRGVILWRMRAAEASGKGSTSFERLTPFWHFFPGHFIPLNKCRSREGSLVARLAEASLDNSCDQSEEEVSIGSVRGTFHIDAIAWGSIIRGTRKVLSFFLSEADFSIARKPRSGHESIESERPIQGRLNI